jgi:hypothetical protein
MDAKLFTDKEIHKRETDALFRQNPLCIGPGCLLKPTGNSPSRVAAIR